MEAISICISIGFAMGFGVFLILLMIYIVHIRPAELNEKEYAVMPENIIYHVDHTDGFCPRCGTKLSNRGKINYCFHCGQKVYWSEDEEDFPSDGSGTNI